MRSADVEEGDVEATSAGPADGELLPSLIGQAAPPLFCAEPSEVLGLAGDQVLESSAGYGKDCHVEEDGEKAWLLQEQRLSDIPQRPVTSDVIARCRDAPTRITNRERFGSFATNNGEDVTIAVNPNRVASSTSVLQCKTCRREPAPFCPVTGSPPRFCSYCGQALAMPSALLQQELSASRIGRSSMRPSARVAQAVAVTRGKAARAVAVTRGKAARTVKAIAAVRPFSYRAILITVILIAGVAALIDVCFPEFLWGGQNANGSAGTENAEKISSKISARGFIALLLMLSTTVFLVYRRRGIVCYITDWRIILSGLRRWSDHSSSQTQNNTSRYNYEGLATEVCSMEAGQVGFRSPKSSPKTSSLERRSLNEDGDSSGFETCSESDGSSDGEQQGAQPQAHRGPHSRQTPLLAWMQPGIREAVLASWSTEQRSKVREVAAFMQRPAASKQEQAMISAFGNGEVCAWRFLRASWDSEIAGQRLRETAHWRAEVLSQRPSSNNGPLFTEIGSVPPVLAHPGAKKLFATNRHTFPCVGWDGGRYEVPGSAAHNRWWNARDGTPVEFWQMKFVDGYEICRCSQEELTDCYMEYNERRRERVNEMHAAGFLIVADAEGVGLSHVRKALRYAWRASLVLEMGERHYPGSVRRFIIFNAPPFVHAVYKAVSPVLSAASRDNIVITASPPEKVSELMQLLEPGTLEAMRAVFH